MDSVTAVAFINTDLAASFAAITWLAIEWMTTHLAEDFETARGAPLHCKSCHRGNLGSPEFQRKIILTNNLPSN